MRLTSKRRERTKGKEKARLTLVDVGSLSVQLLSELLRGMSLNTESLADSEDLEEIGHIWTEVSDDFGSEVGGGVGSDDGGEEGGGRQGLRGAGRVSSHPELAEGKRRRWSALGIESSPQRSFSWKERMG